MFQSPIQLAALYTSRKTTISASTGYFARFFFAKKNLKNKISEKYFILVPLGNNNHLMRLPCRSAKTDYGFP